MPRYAMKALLIQVVTFFTCSIIELIVAFPAKVAKMGPIFTGLLLENPGLTDL